MSFIAGYITGLASSGGDDIFAGVTALPALASFRLTEHYCIVIRYDAAGVFLNTPVIQTSGVTIHGEQIAYVQREWLSRPVIWVCLCRGNTNNTVMINYNGPFGFEGWGHRRTYKYDENCGAYLFEENIMKGTPTLTMAFQPDQSYNIGSLSMQWTYGWLYDRTEYAPDGSIRSVQELTGGIASIPSLPGSLESLVSRMSSSESLTLLHDFAAECEAKRQELIG
ncbi:MAG: hypothetical protein J6I96_01665 [Oscillospiraceae bacterium]|nr:hypothetical protein [Oscillospiraceae bacterium]